MNEIAPGASASNGHLYPARSKMLDVYASDIALLLADGDVESAERQALAIPHIAIALSDAGLQSSRASYVAWCTRWVQPDFGGSAYEVWCRRSGECDGNESGVPFFGLRALRLRRRTREVHARFTAAESSAGVPCDGSALTRALLGAEFRWYEQEGRYQSVVQTNLARLGVLR
jgi:hypothetical protein